MVREMKTGISDRRQLDVLVPGLVDGVETEEGEEQVGLDPFGPGSIGHDQSRVDPFEGSLGDDDRNLLDGVTHVSLLSQMQPRGLGMPAILAAVFAGPLGKSW